MSIDNQSVMVYYCECGTTVERAGDPKHFDRKSWNEYGRMKKQGRKVETITLAEFKQKQFLNCPKCHKD